MQALLYFDDLTPPLHFARTQSDELWKAVLQYCKDKHFLIESSVWNGNTLFIYCY